MKLYFMKQKALDSLKKEIPDNLPKYQSKESWIAQYFLEKATPIYYFDSGIEVDDYELILGGPESDFQNAKIIYEAYKDKLNPVQASDLRLWAYLAHTQHWDYMSSRWKIDASDEELEEDEQEEGKKSPKEKAVDRVKARYFFGASRGKAFVRQGIARLFWSAYLTYDAENENPYEYTEYFFSKQDIFTSITERSYARNKVLVLAALKELKKNPDLSRADIRLFLARLNQAGAITVLDYLDATQAEQLCKDTMDGVHRIPVLEEGSTFKAYNLLTGKDFGLTFTIVNGKVTNAGKPYIAVKPQSLIGKKEGYRITISQQKYIIKDIK